MVIMLILASVALLVMLIFWTAFRDWIVRQLGALWTFITAYTPGILRRLARIVGIYSIVLGSTAVFALVLIIVALSINVPGFTAAAFVLAIGLILLAWTPAGILLKVFHITDGVVPKPMKVFIAWVAFAGFLGLVFPDILTFKSLCGAALVGFIALAITAKINAIDKIIFPFVIVICLGIAWQHFFPENFRSTARYVVSWDKRINTIKDRGSINNETNAATTYGVILKDLETLYTGDLELSENDIIPEEKCELSRGTIVRILNHKQEVRVINGQGFLKIQLAKDGGSFVNGKRYWIEAELVQIVGPRDIIPKDDGLLPKNQQKNNLAAVSEPESVIESPVVRDSIFTKGVYFINVNGETRFNIVVVSNQECNKYQLNSTAEYKIVYEDGVVITDSPEIQQTFPYYSRPRFRFKSNKLITVKMVVA